MKDLARQKKRDQLNKMADTNEYDQVASSDGAVDDSDISNRLDCSDIVGNKIWERQQRIDQIHNATKTEEFKNHVSSSDTFPLHNGRSFEAKADFKRSAIQRKELLSDKDIHSNGGHSS
jgi:hypothetical protein